MSAFMDKVWDKQQLDLCLLMIDWKWQKDAGHDIRRIIEIYTGIDTHTLYK